MPRPPGNIPTSLTDGAPPPGIWLTRSQPRLAYWVIPKSGCSSIKQVLHHLDQGSFFDGDIHDRNGPVLNTASLPGRAEVARIPPGEPLFNFTFVRNPFARLASCFADKIVGFPAAGRRYRLGAVHDHLGAYKVDWGPSADLVTNFRGFVRFVADTVLRQRPMAPDRHWLPGVAHLRNDAATHPNWHLSFVGHVENLASDLTTLSWQAGIEGSRLPATIPRENRSYSMNLPLKTLYGPDEVAIVRRVYADDFRLFGYSNDLEDTGPVTTVDPGLLRAALQVRIAS